MHSTIPLVAAGLVASLSVGTSAGQRFTPQELDAIARERNETVRRDPGPPPPLEVIPEETFLPAPPSITCQGTEP